MRLIISAEDANMFPIIHPTEVDARPDGKVEGHIQLSDQYIRDVLDRKASAIVAVVVRASVVGGQIDPTPAQRALALELATKTMIQYFDEQEGRYLTPEKVSEKVQAMADEFLKFLTK